MGGRSGDVTASGRYDPCSLLPLKRKEETPQRHAPGAKLWYASPRLKSKTAWNWQGEARQHQGTISGPKGVINPIAAVPGPAGCGGSSVERRCDSAGGAVRVKRGGVLQASGEAIIAEKSRIGRRLKELQLERAKLLREEKSTECWAEGGGGKGLIGAKMCASRA